jgi:hypothetical protein
MATAQFGELLDQALALARFDRAVRVGVWLLAMVLALAGGVGLALLLAAVSAPVAARMAALGLGAIAALAAAGRAAWEARRAPSPTRAAARVEQRFPELQDRFVTAVELAWAAAKGAGMPGGTAGLVASCSPGLARVAAQQAAETIRELNLREVVDTRPARRLGVAAAGVALVLLVSVALSPATWTNLLTPTAKGGGVAPTVRRAQPQAAVAGPAIADIALRLDYPTYTGLARETRKDNLEAVSALVGTTVTVTAKVIGERAVAEIAVSGSWQPFGVRGGEGSAAFVVHRDITWMLRATDRAGRTMTTPLCRVKAVADRPPRVSLVEPGKSIAIEAPRAVRLAYEASDDWGLAAIALEYRGPQDAKWNTVMLTADGGKVASGAFDWDLLPLRLSRGQSVVYRLSARDNDAVSGPKTGVTPVYLVTIGEQVGQPTTAQAAQEAATDETAGLEKLEQQAEELGRQLDETVSRLQTGNLNEAERARREAELAEARRRIAEQADQVSRSFAESEQKLKAEGVVPPEVRKKIEELHDLLQQAMNEDLRKTLEQLQEALKSLKPEDLQKSLQQARQSQEDFAQRLEQAIELLKRARLEQQIAQAAQQTEKLAGDQKQLNESREKLKPEQADQARSQSAEQKQLQDREARLESDLRKLAESAQQVDRQTGERLGKTTQKLKDSGAQQSMQQAAERLQQGDPSGAQQPQESAESALNQTAGDLRQAQAGMGGGGAQAAARAAAQMTRDALYLSRQQEEVMQSTDQLAPMSSRSAARGKGEREELRREQETLEQSTRALAGRMKELGRQTPLMSPELVQKATRTADRMAQAAREAAAGAGPQATETQRGAMAGLNELADALAQLSNQAQQASQGSAMQQLLQQLQQLAQQQQGLNQETRQQGGQGSTPRRQGGQQKLAEDQRQIREALERLLQKAGQPSGLPDKLGDVPGRMKDVEQQLREDRLAKETLQRQQDILHRMLDAQRSVYQKNEERRERVSERPKPFRLPPSPPELRPRTPPQTGPRMNAGDTAELPLDFEDVVREYFRALAEGR